MSFTRNQIREMREDQLRSEVLIPLLRAMGFRDVFMHHGGSLEQGKDIVMWKPEEFRERTNFAMVAKAAKITGQATGKSSAAEVSFQVQQAFGKPFNDPVTGVERDVQECIVVSSKDISKEAIESINSFLRNAGVVGHTVFWNGDTLWTLIEKHLPTWGNLNKLAEVQKCFNNLDPHYRLGFNTVGDKVRVTLEQKSPNTPAPQLEIGLKVRFPEDASGKEKLKEFEEHLRTGKPITISKPFLEEVELPEILKKAFGDNISAVGLGSKVTPASFYATLEVTGDNKEKVALEGIELKGVQGGTEEITFTNAEQKVPWKITIIWRQKVGRATVNFEFNYFGFNVHEVLEAMKFNLALAKPGRASFFDKRTGIEFAAQKLGSADKTIPVPPEHWIKFLEDLDYIQRRTQIRIQFPKAGSVNDRVARDAKETTEILKTGKLTFTVDGLRLGGPRKFAEGLLALKDGIVGSLEIKTEEEKMDIAGQIIPLGPSLAFYQQMKLRAGENGRLEQQLKDPKGEVFDAIFEPQKNESICEKFYLNWLSKNEAEAILKRIPPTSPSG